MIDALKLDNCFLRFDEKVLVTGGTGMIGRYLVPKLLSKDYEVFIASLDGEELCPKVQILEN